MRIHLIDGTYELFRAFYAVPSSVGAHGQEVGAARAFCRSLAGWLGSGKARHVAVAFDTVIESFRNDLFDGYKTGEGIDPALFAQFPLVERVSRALGLVTWSMHDFEADDALATFAARAADDPRVEQVLLCTPDKDLTQCVRGARVVLHDRYADKVLDEAGVIAKFGVAPASIPDYLALVGDAADGIPGVPRWGAKAASTLLARFGHVERIPDDPLVWDVPVRGKEALARSLSAHRLEVELYRRLATLRLDVPLTETVDDLAFRGAPREELLAVCAEIGDTRTPDSIRFR
jgi:5'-3' exonuclease